MKRYFISVAQGGGVCALIYHCITSGSHTAAKLIIMFPATQHDLTFVYWRKYKYGFTKALHIYIYILWYEKARDSGEGVRK